MAAAQHELDHFRDFLKDRGLKLTQQRLTILERALGSERHFSAEELSDQVRGEEQRISKATVYRTLALLVEAGMLDTHDFERGHTVYERAAHGKAHHDHLICVACDSVFEFHNEEIERLQLQVASRFDFAMVSHTHQIYGVCGRCRAKGVRPEEAAVQTRHRSFAPS
ncbi:MAG: Fur family transcriptional regulator [Planctomycetota bacterium]